MIEFEHAQHVNRKANNKSQGKGAEEQQKMLQKASFQECQRKFLALE